jgi:hypothetical protein
MSMALLVDASPALATTPDPVLEWIGVMNDTVLAGNTSPLSTSRAAALMSAAVFDAVNGIEPQFRPLHVRPDVSRSASQRAAAIQAAYAILLDLYPGQSASLAAHRCASLEGLSLHERASSIDAGIAWGQKVADAIWQWRLADGIAPVPPPFVGVLGIEDNPAATGVWRPTPPANAFGAGPQFASMTPWVLRRPSEFRLPPPLALDSAEYATELNEIRVMGVQTGSLRTADQSELALFWNGNTPLYWNRIALQLATRSSFPLAQNAHLFALLNVTMADAAIACWDGKYRYVFWRPITAIRAGSGGVGPEPSWEPWLDFFPAGTPAHPEYPSGHSTVSGAAAFILASVFGENTAFTVTSDVRPGTRSFASFSAATSEIADARVFGGIHFRTSCVRGNLLGRTVAEYVSKHALRATDDRDEDEDSDH